jgi:hypothetical protein
MSSPTARSESSTSFTAQIRQRIESGGERLWRHEDFADLPPTAVAQSLSRLARAGKLQRLSKGIYYRSRKTTFGESRPNPAALRALITTDKTIFPAGIMAANLLGFSTQNPKRREIATTAPSLPRKLLGDDTIVHTRRPSAWQSLTEEEAALLDFLRRRGDTSELSEEETTKRLLRLLTEKDRFAHLLTAAPSEPPRVCAMLGSIGEELGKTPSSLKMLRKRINPLSRYDFGALTPLKFATKWQAKERPNRETISTP